MGYLHVPHPNANTNGNNIGGDNGNNNVVPTLTILPPKPDVLLPLLLAAVTQENKVNKWDGLHDGPTPNQQQALMMQQQSTKHVQLNDSWKADFRAYLFSIPAYYKFYMKRYIKPLLPRSVAAMVNSVGGEDGVGGGGSGSNEGGGDRKGDRDKKRAGDWICQKCKLNNF